MANIKFSRKTFEKDFGKLDSKMQEKIFLFGTPLESLTKEEVEIEIFPDRPDLLSYQGFKRGFSGFLGKKTGLKNYKLNKPEKNFQVIIDSSVKTVRPYTACAIVKGLKLNDERIKEIIELQEKLHTTVGRKRKKLAIGIYPLEKITLPITYKALEPDKIKFIPLDAGREMSGLQILQRHPTGKEYAHLLAGKVKFPIFIDANKKVLSMPPIVNSQETGKVSANTKDVFVECSGHEFRILEKCLNIVITSLAEMGGIVYQMNLKGAPKRRTPDLTTEKNKLSLDHVNSLLGLKLNEKQLKHAIEKMGHNYNKGIVESPSWRIDLLHEVDLIEDVAIAYGYDKFVPKIPEISTIGQENPRETLKRKISEIISGLGILEISNYHMTNKKNQFTKMGIPEKQEKSFIDLQNSKTDYNILRKDLTHFLLRTFSENLDSEYPQRIFEMGRVFELKKDIEEKERIGCAITPGNFTEIRQILEYLFRMLNLNLQIKEPKTNETPIHYIEGRVASILVNNREIGFMGEIHPKILRNWKIKMPVALFELNLEEIFKEII